MKIGIVGMGYVGKAMCEFFERRYSVVGYDEPLGIGSREKINACDCAVVCVPTPQADDGHCDTSVVESVVGWLETPLIIIKSTVAPGTTDRLVKQRGKPIIFSPEYCGESSYWSPYAFHTSVVETPFFIFGGNPELTRRAVDLYMPIAGPVKRYIQTTAVSAELAKYMENCFFATKISFCYEMAEICRAFGADYNTVRELWLNDPRINPMHTAVFSENSRPFSGKCLPKDLAGLIATAKASGTNPMLLEAVQAMNNEYQR
jgi:nucleotide sugar dehydrogenase